MQLSENKNSLSKKNYISNNITNNELIDVFDNKKTDIIIDSFLKEYPEYKKYLENNTILSEEVVELRMNELLLKLYYILITFKKIEKSYEMLLTLKKKDFYSVSYERNISFVKKCINIIKSLEDITYGEKDIDDLDLLLFLSKEEFYIKIFRVKKIDHFLDKINYLQKNKYIILNNKDIDKFSINIDIKKVYPKLLNIKELEKILFNFNIDLIEYISSFGKDKELIRKLYKAGANKYIIYIIIKYIFIIRKFIFIDKKFIDNGIVGEEDKILEVLDIYKDMIDIIDTNYLSYIINLSSLLSNIGINNEKTLKKYLDTKKDIDKIEKILTIYCDNINKYKTETNKLKYIDFLYKNYTFSVKYHKLIKKVSIKYFDKVQQFINNDYDLVEFYIINDLYKFDFNNKKVEIIYKLSNKYDINDLLNLDINNLELLQKNNISRKGVKLLLKGVNFENIKNNEEIQNYKNHIKDNLENIDGIITIKDSIDEIYFILDQINLENYKKNKLIIDKKIKQFENIILKIKLIKENLIDLKKIHDLINLFINKKTKKNKLKLGNILEIIQYISKYYDSNDIDIIILLLENKLLKIEELFLANYENILKNIKNNLEIVISFIDKNNKKNISFTDINDIINSKKNIDIIKDITSIFFSKELEEFILEIADKDLEKFNKLVTLSKIIFNKQDIDFYLDLISLNTDKFNKYYFLIKNLHILGIDLSNKYNEIFSLIDLEIFTENKLKDIKKIFKGNKIILDKDIFYSLLVDYLSYDNLDIDIFNILFEQEQIENNNDDEFEKNTGIKGLAGWSGKDIIKRFEKLGFKRKVINGKIQGKGSHVLMKNQKNIYTMIPMHKTVRAKTLFDTLNRAKISKEDFLNI